MSYFQKNFLHAMAVLGYLSKLKRGLGLALGAHFLHDFSTKCSLLILYQWTKFQCNIFFPSQVIKQNVLLSLIWTVGDVINLKIYLRSTSKAMADRGKKGEDENTKI